MQLAMRFIATSCSERGRQAGRTWTGQTASAIAGDRTAGSFVSKQTTYLPPTPSRSRKSGKTFPISHSNWPRFKMCVVEPNFYLMSSQCLFTICSSIHSKFSSTMGCEELSGGVARVFVLPPTYYKQIAYTPRSTQVQLIYCSVINNAKCLVSGNKFLRFHLKHTLTRPLTLTVGTLQMQVMNEK